MNKAMNKLISYRLACEVILWRSGYVWLILGLIVLITASLQLLVLPNQQEAIQQAREELNKLETARLQQLEQNSDEIAQQLIPLGEREILEQLWAAGIEEQQISDVLRRVIAIAQHHDIELDQSEFQYTEENLGGLKRLQVTLPLNAGYPQIKQFTTAVLLEFPGISVDDLTIKRDSVAKNQVEIRVKVSLWTKGHRGNIGMKETT